VIYAKEVEAEVEVDAVRRAERRRRRDVPRTKIFKRICLEEEDHQSRRHVLDPSRSLGARVAVAMPKDLLPSTRGHLPGTAALVNFVMKRAARVAVAMPKDPLPSTRGHLPGTAALVDFV